MHRQKKISREGDAKENGAGTFATVGGGRRIRTDGILLAKQTLYQLSYTPYARENAWWA